VKRLVTKPVPSHGVPVVLLHVSLVLVVEGLTALARYVRSKYCTKVTKKKGKSKAAFGNMCRGGRMFAPTKIWRKWHVKVNQNQRRFAVVSALAATALPSLVLARGHRIETIEEVPLVVDASAESFTKTKQAVALLKSLHAYADVVKVSNSRKLRAGKGKLRNRRHRQRRGPLVVYNEDNGIVKAFRNLPGVELVNVRRLNLLQLAPGGHLGRFVIWTQGAFALLDEVFGTFETPSLHKKDYMYALYISFFLHLSKKKLLSLKPPHCQDHQP
jgi:large subunit ribosomal protein L4e